ncbi:MAG: hypothetical protein M0037_05990 [Betaproteobacteria bacterium]|nr:hypothetical protein [Betaproteobacteria bacterium]
MSHIDGSFKIPDGLARCADCGEYRGQVRRGDLSGLLHAGEDPDKTLTISCLCAGILCSKCKKNRIHRPISNSYDPETKTFGHWAYFSGMAPCRECRERERRRG